MERARQINQDQKLDFQIDKLSDQDMRDLAFFGANNILNLEDEEPENIDIDKLLADGEKAAEDIARTLEDKVKEYSDKATDFGYESTITKFEGENLRGKNIDKEAVRKMLMENLQQMGKILEENGPRAVKKNYKLEYRSMIDPVPFHYFAGSDGERLTELKKKQENHLFFKDREPETILKDQVVEDFSEEEAEELDSLTKKIKNIPKKDYDSFIRGMKAYGRHNLDDIRKEYLPDWSDEQLYDYACRFWRDFTTIPNYKSLLVVLEREEFKYFKRTYCCLVLEEAFGKFETDDDIHLPISLQNYLNFVETKRCHESFAAFMLFYHSRLLSNKHQSASIKALMIVHPCLKTDFISLSFTEKNLESKLEKIADRFMTYYGISPPENPSKSSLLLPYDFESLHSIRKNSVWLCGISKEVSQMATEAIEKMRLLGGVFSHMSSEEDKEGINRLKWLAESKRQGKKIQVMSTVMEVQEAKLIEEFKKSRFYKKKEGLNPDDVEDPRSDSEDIKQKLPTMERDAEYSNATIASNKSLVAENKKNKIQQSKTRRPLFDLPISKEGENSNHEMDVEDDNSKSYGLKKNINSSSSSNRARKLTFAQTDEVSLSNSLAVSSSQAAKTVRSRNTRNKK